MCHTASTHNNWRIPYISNIDNFHYFLCVNRTFIKTDHIAGYKKKLQKFKKQRFYRSHYLILIQLVKKNYQKMAKNCLLENEKIVRKQLTWRNQKGNYWPSFTRKAFWLHNFSTLLLLSPFSRVRLLLSRFSRVWLYATP